MADNSGGANTADGSVREREMEVILAEMETKLRSTILRIIRPTLDQTVDVVNTVELIKEQVKRHEEMLGTAEHLRAEVARQRDLLNVFADSLGTRDKQMRDFETKTTDMNVELGGKIKDIEQKLERAQGEMRKQARETGRVWDEVARQNDVQLEGLRSVRDDVDIQWKRADKNREEIWHCVKQLQVQREDLMEELFGEEKVLSQLRMDINNLRSFVEPLPGIESSLSKAVADISMLDKNMITCAERCDETVYQLDEFSKKSEQKYLEMQETTRQKCNQLVAHNAAVMNDIRHDYTEEIHAARRIRSEVTDFKLKTDGFCADLAGNLDAERHRLDALNKQMRTDLEDLHKKCDKDRVHWESQIQELKREGSSSKEITQVARMSVEYIGRIVGLVLEGERLTNAIVIQDFVDRSSEKWLTMQSDSGRVPESASSAETLMDLKRMKRQLSSDHVEKVTPADLKKGFLRDGYKPGQVVFRGVKYDRLDALLLHSTLLKKAHRAYNDRCPPNSDEFAFTAEKLFAKEKSDRVGHFGQPGANGGPMAGGQFEKLVGSKAASTPGEEEEQKSNWRRGSGAQRPGSQGQPQAVGSRGSMAGPLGETEPPGSVVPPVKLPELGPERGTTGTTAASSERGSLRTLPNSATSSMAFSAGSGFGGNSGGGAPALPSVGKPQTAR